MKKIVYLLVLALLALLAGCDLFCPEDEPSGWIEIAGQDFPVYVGHFADYEHTDASGNSLGTVVYGEDGDASDWQIFAYDPSTRGALPKMAVKAGGARDEYHILVQAFSYTSVDLGAAILFNGNDTGFITPHTFSYQGAYDPALEDSFLCRCPIMSSFAVRRSASPRTPIPTAMSSMVCHLSLPGIPTPPAWMNRAMFC
ncbi:MAG: hypothetical protein LHW57_05325 [Candidatus Cloacimonetes bacterium]|nr:hypothetical protein [Candidatus Cloacimonadota bacterium]